MTNGQFPMTNCPAGMEGRGPGGARGVAMSDEKEAHVRRMAERDPEILGLLTEGYAFVTNAFRPDRKPAGLRVEDADGVARDWEREGYAAAIANAYDERGNPRPEMASVWRRRRDARG